MKMLHAIAVKYVGPTDRRGSRVKLTSYRFDESVTLPYDYDAAVGFDKQAEAWLEANGFTVVGKAETPTGTLLLSSTFEPLKERKA